MKNKLKYFVLFIGLLFLANGCIQVETNVNVNKDGSGTIEETVTFSPMVLSMLKEFAGSFNDSTESGSFKIFNEDELKQKASGYGEGVEFVSGEQISKDNRQGFRAIYSFKDLNKISLSPDVDNEFSPGTENESSEINKDQFKFSFITGKTPEVIIIAKNKKMNKDSEESEEGENEFDTIDSTFVEMMKGMKIDMNVIFNGEIISTNSSYRDKNKITLLGIDFSSIISNPEALKKMSTTNPESLEEFKEIVKDISGIELETNYPVSVKFK